MAQNSSLIHEAVSSMCALLRVAAWLAPARTRACDTPQRCYNHVVTEVGRNRLGVQISDEVCHTEFTMRRKNERITSTDAATEIADDAGRRSGGSGSVQDITERNNMREQLHLYMQRLEILRELDRAILTAQSPETIAKAALSHVRQLIAVRCASVITYDFDTNTVHKLLADSDNETQRCAREQFGLDSFVDTEELRAGRYQLVPDIAALSAPRPIDRQLLSEGVRSYINMPLCFQGELFGSLNLGGEQPHAFSGEHIEIIKEVADSLAIALHQARLHEQVRHHADDLEQRVAERTVELEQANALLQQAVHEYQQAEAAEREQRTLSDALREIAAILIGTLDLDGIFELILASVGQVVPHDNASIMLVEEGIARVVRCRGYENEDLEKIIMAARFVVESIPNLRQMVHTGRPMVISDTSDYPGWVQVPGLPRFRSYLGTPIQRGGKTIGFLNLAGAKRDFFTEIQAERLGTFAHLAAIALQNAENFVQVQELAALKERQRLARELHDAVSQTLWSASLVADLVPAVWEQDVTKGREKLLRLSQLMRGALAEMRLLLLELRPSSLVEMEMGEALRQLIAATICRTQKNISLTVKGQCSLSPEVQVALYRIAQEALNNAVRHADASQIAIELRCMPEQLSLAVSDNGRGFDPATIPPGHLGLEIMRERAAAIGAEIEIASGINQGTRITVSGNGPARGITNEHATPHPCPDR